MQLILKNLLPNMMLSSNRSHFSFLLLISSIIQQIGLSSGCTPAGSGCCSSPRPASCGNLPPCSPVSLSASHLSSYSHVAPPPKNYGHGHGNYGGSYGYGHEEGGKYGYDNDGGYEIENNYYPPSESYGYVEKPKFGGGGYISKPMYPPPPPTDYSYPSYSTGAGGYGQPSSYQPPPIQPYQPPSLSSYSVPQTANPNPQPAYPIAPLSLYPISPPINTYSNPIQSVQYPQLYPTSSYNGQPSNSYYPTNSMGTYQYNEMIMPPNNGAYSGQTYGYDSVGSLPPAIAPPNNLNYPQSGIGGDLSMPPNGPFLMNLANSPMPPGGYKMTKKKILLVEKAKGKSAATSSALTRASAKNKKEMK